MALDTGSNRERPKQPCSANLSNLPKRPPRTVPKQPVGGWQMGAQGELEIVGTEARNPVHLPSTTAEIENSEIVKGNNGVTENTSCHK